MIESPSDGVLALHETLSKYAETLKKSSELMRWREATLMRKLKSQIRSRKLAETNKKRLQFDSGRGASSQL